MKIYKFLFFAIILAVFLLAGRVVAQATFNPFRPLCVGISGKFYANSSWKGGSIQVGCVGDNGLATNDPTQRCTGEVQTVGPGQAFRLTKCSCLGSDKGCLKIGKELRLEPLVDGKRSITVVRRIDEMPAFVNNSCKINKFGDMCGTNGQHITGNVKITCNVPNSPTPKLSTSPTPKPSSSPSPSVCPSLGKVTNVKVSCPNCSATPTPEQSN